MSITKGVALITGSAQGIGRSIALRLAKDGFDIALNDLPSQHEKLCAVANEVEKLGRKSCLVPGDVTIEEDVARMVEETVSGLGSLRVMVANAGTVNAPALLTSVDLDEWERVMAVNTRGPFLCYKYAAKQMIKQGQGGRIIGASSVTGKMGCSLSGPYCASKWAVRGLTQTAALELGRYGITVNAYAPGLIKTSLTEDWITPEAFATLDQESIKWFMNVVSSRPIKIDGEPSHIASLVSYLASEEANFITGQCIAADGGITMS